MEERIINNQWMKALLLLPLFCLGFLPAAQAQVNINQLTDADAHFYIDSWRVTHAEFLKFDMNTMAQMSIDDDSEGTVSIFIGSTHPKDSAEAPGKINGIPVSQGILDKLDPDDIDALTVTREGKLIITTKSGKITYLAR